MALQASPMASGPVSAGAIVYAWAPIGGPPKTLPRCDNGIVSRPPLSKVIEREAAALMELPGVEGVAEGRENDEPCVVVLTSGDAPAGLPGQVSGYPVTVRRSGPIEAQ